MSIFLYTDPSQQLFADRLIQPLADLGVKSAPFSLPSKNMVSCLNWWLKLARSENKIIHYIWGLHHPLAYILPKLAGKKVIVHWIGTDVLGLPQFPRRGIWWKLAIRMVDLHLAVSEPLAGELKTQGINAGVVSLIADFPPQPVEIHWPPGDAIFVYLPESRKEFFHQDLVFQLAEQMPNVTFLITCHRGDGGSALKNIKYLGFVKDMEKLWEQVKVYLRIVDHDGLSLSVIEALARGKHVVWSNPFPHCHRAGDVEGIKGILKNIFQNDKPNIEGMKFAQAEYNPRKIAADFKNVYMSLSGRNPRIGK
ncbi:MAG: hypothetical protein PHE84_02090 [bacterium]|nr:hypothetical protein [bacterium]